MSFRSFSAQNAMRYQHAPGFQPFHLLSDFEKKGVMKNHEQAISWLQAQAPTQYRFFTGVPDPSAPVEGFDALMYMVTMNKVISLFRGYHPQETCYVSDELMMRWLFPASLRESREHALQESPASIWYSELHDNYKTNLLVFWSHFVARWMDANLLTDYFIADFESIKMSAYLDRRTNIYDTPQYLIRVEQIDTYLLYLTSSRLDGPTKYRTARQHHFASAAALWEKLWEKGARSWSDLTAQLRDYHTQNIYKAGSVPRSQPGALPTMRPGTHSSSQRGMPPYGYNPRLRNRSDFEYGSQSPSNNRFNVLQDMDVDSDPDSSGVVLCDECHLESDVEDEYCVCMLATDFIPCDASEPGTEYTQCVEALCATYDREPPPSGRLDPALSICFICNKVGHFGKDCREIGGRGSSVKGERYGSAPGFKKGDDPALRDPRYVEWVLKRKAAFNKARSESLRRNPRNSGRLKGKMKTHARRLKTGKATNPPKSHYQIVRQLNLLLTDLDDDLSSIDSSSADSYQTLMTALSKDDSPSA